MEVVNRIYGKYGNKLFINTELVLLFRLHGNSRPDGCCSRATHIWPNCRRGDGSTCDWGKDVILISLKPTHSQIDHETLANIEVVI